VGQQRSEFAALFSVVEHAARDANLIFSHIHLSELAHWPDVDAARAMAAWLDGIPLVWARIPTHVAREEHEHWTKVVAGCTNVEPVRFCAPSMLSTFEGGPVSLNILDTHSLTQAFEEEIRDKSIARKMNRMALAFAAQANLDRKSLEQTSEQNRKRFVDETEYRRGVQLRKAVLRADRRLTQRPDLSYLERRSSLNDVVPAFVEVHKRNARSLPLTRVFDRLAKGFVETSAQRDIHGKNILSLSSSLGDIFHALIGAAYCDVFTCDQLTARWLGDVRESLGWSAPLVFTGHAAEFAKGIAATLEAALLVRRSA
jgi:hypothetical protein